MLKREEKPREHMNKCSDLDLSEATVSKAEQRHAVKVRTWLTGMPVSRETNWRSKWTSRDDCTFVTLSSMDGSTRSTLVIMHTIRSPCWTSLRYRSLSTYIRDWHHAMHHACMHTMHVPTCQQVSFCTEARRKAVSAHLSASKR